MDCWVGPRPRIPSRPALACNQPVLCRSEQFGRRGRGSLSQRIGFSLLDMFHSCSGSAKKRRQQVLVTLYAHPLIQTSPSMWVQILSPSLPLSLSPSLPQPFFHRCEWSSCRRVRLGGVIAPCGSACTGSENLRQCEFGNNGCQLMLMTDPASVRL